MSLMFENALSCNQDAALRVQIPAGALRKKSWLWSAINVRFAFVLRALRSRINFCEFRQPLHPGMPIAAIEPDMRLAELLIEMVD